MLTLYDAARCPYCARVRIVLAEKAVPYETVNVDLDERPAWIYDLNATGRVPVLDDDGLVLPESRVLIEYLDERFPEPPLLPADQAARARVRLLLERFDENLGDAYYDLRREPSSRSARDALGTALDRLTDLVARQPHLSGEEYGLADCAYVPWLFRAEAALDVDVRTRPALADWLGRLEGRPAIAAELSLVAATP
ncbi:MAG TPA: glutathione S-transferase family protein [Gaiellaceae bacterium]|nr:glutathione S-transferase family protein [Gaiellaceae bacterium]